MDRARDTEAWAAREHPLEIVLYPDPQVDPVGAPDRTDDLVGRYVEVGATVLNLRFRAHSVQDCADQLEAMAARPEFTPSMS
jgi:hypothetical protein